MSGWGTVERELLAQHFCNVLALSGQNSQYSPRKVRFDEFYVRERGGKMAGFRFREGNE